MVARIVGIVFGLGICISLIAESASVQALTFKKKSVVVAKHFREALTKMVQPQDVITFEPHTDENRVYQGVNFQALLSKVYGPVWQQSEEILFTCQDGYQPSVPVAKVKKNAAYLVFNRSGGKFVIDNKSQNKTNVELGPYYLVWENIKNQAVRGEGVSDWPYQVVAIDLIQFVDKFPNIAPPPKSSEAVVAGFLAFRKHCIRCHTVNGEGGSMGVELNYPVSVTEYWKEDWLAKWIIDPAAIRHKSTMPGIKQSDSTPEKTSKEIIAYLKSMVKKKKAPRP